MTKYLGADSDLHVVNCVRRVNVLAELIFQKYNTDTDKIEEEEDVIRI